MRSLFLRTEDRTRWVPVIIVLVLLSVLGSCGFSVNDEHSYQSADQEHTDRLIKLLNQRGIPYTFKDGEFRYNDSEKVEFDKAQNAFDTAASDQFIDPGVRKYFHALLNTEGIEYIESDRDGGSWTMWWPGSEDRKMNILGQVVEYKITAQLEEDADCESSSSDAHTMPSLIQDALNKGAL